jgi:hypothetical protein
VHDLHVCYHSVLLYLCLTGLLGGVVDAYALIALGGAARGQNLELSLEREDFVG